MGVRGIFLFRYFPSPNLVSRPLVSFIAKEKDEFFYAGRGIFSGKPVKNRP
jgi:hypothetical protein